MDGGVLQPREFWQGQQALLRSEAGRQATAQRAGLSSAMLGDVQRNADGQTDRVCCLAPLAEQNVSLFHACIKCNIDYLLVFRPSKCCIACGVLTRIARDRKQRRRRCDSG